MKNMRLCLSKKPRADNYTRAFTDSLGRSYENARSLVFCVMGHRLSMSPSPGLRTKEIHCTSH
ncbi:hypothetical protein KSP40_PGU007473 [Platanthera guangdongensis]|uniref:Uncharacterized protein n=1 Tax=Platanthera guangdongensis TaxID=2320717 RepID=A0ABR2LMA1_9ASPA